MFSNNALNTHSRGEGVNHKAIRERARQAEYHKGRSVLDMPPGQQGQRGWVETSGKEGSIFRALEPL